MSKRDRLTLICFYCGDPISRRIKTKDHVIPTALGGSNDPKNLVDACKPCNQLKGHLTLEEFRAVMAHRKGLLPEIKMRFPGELRRLKD